MTERDKEYVKQLVEIATDIALISSERLFVSKQKPRPFVKGLIVDKLRENFYIAEVAELLGTCPSAIVNATARVKTVMRFPSYAEQAIYYKWHKAVDGIKYEHTDKHR